MMPAAFRLLARPAWLAIIFVSVLFISIIVKEWQVVTDQHIVNRKFERFIIMITHALISWFFNG